jgi:hypothetical protein
VRGVVGGGELAVQLVPACTDGATCAAPSVWRVDDAGDAFDLADVDQDGRVELITASASAPGDPDRVTVYSLGDSGPEPVITKRFAGGVVAITTGDVDGDGAGEVVTAVRLLGSDRIDLWTLD